MKTAVIYYFSGTGNTELVADMLKEEFVKNEYEATLIRIEDVLKNNLAVDMNKYDLAGVGSQIIGFAAPNLVHKFIRRLPEGGGKKLFIFRTAGGIAPINYNASKPMIRQLRRKGYEVFYERIFSISRNWISSFDNEVVYKLYDATKRKTAIMCRDVISGKKRLLKTGLRLKLIMELTSHIAPPIMRLTGKDLKVNSTCTHCGLCIKNCPAGNICEKKGHIKFKFSCNGCMRCVYSCPKNAVNYRLLKFFYIPEGYNIKRLLSKKDEGNAADNIKEPPFLKKYIADDDF